MDAKLYEVEEEERKKEVIIEKLREVSCLIHWKWLTYLWV